MKIPISPLWQAFKMSFASSCSPLFRMRISEESFSLCLWGPSSGCGKNPGSSVAMPGAAAAVCCTAAPSRSECAAWRRHFWSRCGVWEDAGLRAVGIWPGVVWGWSCLSAHSASLTFCGLRFFSFILSFHWSVTVAFLLQLCSCLGSFQRNLMCEN